MNIEKNKRDKRTIPATREIMKILASYDGKLNYNINVEKETEPYIKGILDYASTQDLTVEEFRFCIHKVLDILNYMLDGVTKSLNFSEDSFMRKVLGKNPSEVPMGELHQTLLGNIKYEKKY